MESAAIKQGGKHFVALLSFFIIMAAIVLVDSICHAYLTAETNTFSHYHLAVESTAAFLATLLVLLLFLGVRQFSLEGQAKELLKTKKDWGEIFNTMTDFVSVHDKNFKIIKANQALCDLLGKAPEEIIGKYCYQIFHNLNEPYGNCPHQKAAAINHSVTEIVNDTNIGFPLQITCSPLFDDEGKFHGSVHIARGHENAGNQKIQAENLIPICASCKNIRTAVNNWMAPEEYFITICDTRFTHTLCRSCQQKLYPEFINS